MFENKTTLWVVHIANHTQSVLRAQLAELDDAGWHVDYALKNRQAQGGGAHYLIDAQTGAIRTKRYEQ